MKERRDLISGDKTPPCRTPTIILCVVQASYMVFEKMKLEGFGGNEEVRLRTIIKIKKVAVGRIIGKSGKTVRELQRATGAMIRLPEDPSVQGEEVTVEVYGNFMSTQVCVFCIDCILNGIIKESLMIL